VHVSRAGTRLIVSWKPVPGTWRYATILLLDGGRRELLVSRGPRVTFIGVAPYDGGTVRISALGVDQRRVSASPRSFKATANRPARRHR
jgi:hypothetical protein